MSTNELALRALNLLFGENSIEMSDKNARLYDEIVNALTGEQPQSDVQRDAERYGWLINNSFDRSGVTQIHCWLHEWQPHSKTGKPTEWMSRLRGPAIERVIDAEIAKERT